MVRMHGPRIIRPVLKANDQIIEIGKGTRELFWNSVNFFLGGALDILYLTYNSDRQNVSFKTVPQNLPCCNRTSFTKPLVSTIAMYPFGIKSVIY